MSNYLLIDIIGPDQHDNREDNRHSEPALKLWDLVDAHSQGWLCHGSSSAACEPKAPASESGRYRARALNRSRELAKTGVLSQTLYAQ